MLKQKFLFLFAIFFALPISVISDDTSKSNRFVSYEQFGAKGDGKTDDQEAIAKAHAYANENNLPVKVKDDATYYIGSGSNEVIIRTDTDFGKAKFIIDDRNLNGNRSMVFKVKSDKESSSLEGISTLRKNQKKIDTKFAEPCLVQVFNANVKKFIRKGSNQNSGSGQRDIFLVDKEGNVDESTPIIWDFNEITSSKVIPIDDKPIRLTGGVFITMPSHQHSSKYHGRGISVNRTNVTVKGLKHLIEKTGEDGAPYNAFLGIGGCANVLVEDCTFTGRRTYYKIGSAGRRVAMGSYGTSVGNAVNVRFVNCKQTNSISDSKYWGIMASNHSKNIEYDHCKLSRFDAHQGVTNATIRNSVLRNINAIGNGQLVVENTEVRNRNFINFRGDYGSTWNGDVTIRNCVLAPPGKKGNINIFNGHNEGNHDFGYTCYMPENILIDGLKIKDKRYGEKSRIYLFSDYNRKFKQKNYQEKYPIVRTKKVTLRNVETESGNPIHLSENKFMFESVKVIREK